VEGVALRTAAAGERRRGVGFGAAGTGPRGAGHAGGFETAGDPSAEEGIEGGGGGAEKQTKRLLCVVQREILSPASLLLFFFPFAQW
jgi:hypothetical protein